MKARDNIEKLTPYSSARDQFTDIADVYLDANENPFETEVNRYPDPRHTELRSLWSEAIGCNAANMVVGNGSDEILDMIIRSYCEPKQDEILTIDPSYGMYKVLADINSVVINAVKLKSDFSLDAGELVSAISPKTKVIVLCSPNNPTGELIPFESIEQICGATTSLVVVDEAYIEFAEKPSAVCLLEKFPNLIVSRTLSKAYGMAGIRVGCAVASKAIIATLNKMKMPYNVSVLNQIAAINRLKNRVDVEKELQIIKSERSRLASELQNINYISEVFPSDANFILARFNDANTIYKSLVNEGIVVRNRSNQYNCENCLRISIGTPEENSQLISALKKLEK